MQLRPLAPSPDKAIEEATLPADKCARDGTGTPPETLRITLRTIHRLRLRGEATTLSAIATACGLGRMTVVRAVEVLTRDDVGLVLPAKQRSRGRQAANHYAVHWTKISKLCRDEALALFARRYGASQAAGEPVAKLSTVGAGQSTVAGEQSTVTVHPRDSGRGGKGGRCALDYPTEEEQEQIDSCSSSAARHGTQNSPHGTQGASELVESATWAEARDVMIRAGVYVKGIDDLIGDFEARGGKPADAIALCDYRTGNPDRLDINGGALRIAIQSWGPGLEYDSEGLWPQAPLPEAESPERPKQPDREMQRLRIIGVHPPSDSGSRELINVQLAAAGFDVARDGLITQWDPIAERLRHRVKAPLRESDDKPP